MEQLVLERIHQLLTYRRWHYTNRRLIDWPDMRHDDRVELRALVRLLKQWRRLEAAKPDPVTAAKAYAELGYHAAQAAYR